MKKQFESIRRQNTPGLSLDEAILARAAKLEAGKKVILSEQRKERNGMSITINTSEHKETAKVGRNHGAFIAAAAAIAVIGAGTFAAVNLNKSDIQPGSEVSAAEINEQQTSEAPEPPAPAQTTEVQEWAKPYIEKYPEMVAYLDMDLGDGDTISYPVVQHSDNDYYLYHTAEGNELDAGAVFANCNYPINKISERPDNIVLFGNTMINYSGDQMFTSLARYNDPDFFLSGHNTFEFNTIYEEQGQQYRIFAAFIYNPDICELDYWDYCDFDKPLYDFGDWISYVKEAGIYDSTVACSPNDQYVTLSTTVPDGEDDERMVVVAKKITENDPDTQPVITDSKDESSEDSSPTESQIENSTVTVPEVVGLTRAQAIASLRDYCLNYEIEEVSYEGHRGEVVEQSIRAGETVDRGTVVTIFISTGESDPIPLTLHIPVPEGLRGSYTFDVYRDGSVAYTRTIERGETVASEIEFDILGKFTERLTVYVKSNDLGRDNYILYAAFNVDYDKGTIELDGEPGYSQLLEITPAER